MGYCINLKESTFKIKKEKADGALVELKNLADSTYLRWVDKYEIINAKNIEDAFTEIGYSLKKDNNGDYVIDCFENEKLGSEFKIFGHISNFVEDGYIQMYGSDGAEWRWKFENGLMKEISPRLVWD